MAYKSFITKSDAPHLTYKRITWHFNPPSAPHFGGLWGAGEKSTKYHLKRCIGERVLTFEKWATTLEQIESCLNSRSPCPISNDPNDLLVLTPKHFLTGDALLAPPTAAQFSGSLTQLSVLCSTILPTLELSDDPNGYRQRIIYK